MSLRALARRKGCAASTVMRQVRRYENRRDDPLVDEALAAAWARPCPAPYPVPRKGECPTCQPRSAPTRIVMDDATIAREARRILRRLAEPGCGAGHRARHGKGGGAARPAGRAHRAHRGGGPRRGAGLRAEGLDRLPQARAGCELRDHGGRARRAEALAATVDAGRAWPRPHAPSPASTATGPSARSDEPDGPRRMRYNLAESPVAVLGRRRDKDGKPFLERRSGRGGRTAARGFRTGPDGAARGAELGPVPDRRRPGRLPRRLRAGRRAARRARPGGGGAARPWARALATWCCAAAAFWKGWRPRKSGWAGRRGPARSCCASRCSA